MKSFWVIQVVLIVTAVLLFISTPEEAGALRVLEHRVVCNGSSSFDDPCWMAFGGAGAISLGMGVGLVSWGWIGAGVLFGLGQVTTGLIAFGQGAFGPLFFCAQLGVGLSGIGQIAIGGRVVGQAPIGAPGAEFLKDLNQRLNRVLAFV